MSDAGRRVHYLSTLDFPPAWLAELEGVSAEVDVRQVPAEKAADVPDELWETVDVLHTSTVFPEPSTAPRLRWVQLDTSGVNHVRSQPLWETDIEITTIGGISPVPLAEYVLFAILAFAHRLPAMLDVRASRTWPSPAERWQRFLPSPLDQATVGIVGFGRIGREVARLARAHGMGVVGLNRSASPRSRDERTGFVDFGRSGEQVEAEVVGPGQLHELLGRSDFVVVVLPLTDETCDLIDAAAIAAMKPGAVLINVARGGIVDETALLAALRSGAVGGVVLDTFAEEPLPPDSPWWSQPNAFVTPHVAGLAPHYAEGVLRIVSENLRRFLAGQPLLNRVDRLLGY